MTPSSPPMGSSAAATCTSAWVSTPPVMARISARVSTMVTAIPFLRLKGWHAPEGVGPVKPWPLIQARQISPAMPVGARKNWDPADRSFRKTTRSGVSRLGGQAGTQAPDPTRPSVKIREAGPEALHTLSLPIASGRRLHQRRLPGHADHPILGIPGPAHDRLAAASARRYLRAAYGYLMVARPNACRAPDRAASRSWTAGLGTLRRGVLRRPARIGACRPGRR